MDCPALEEGKGGGGGDEGSGGGAGEWGEQGGGRGFVMGR